MRASLLSFATKPRENRVIVRSDTQPADFRMHLRVL